MKDIVHFIAGFKRFQERYFSQERELFERLRHGQNPRALIIACSDSRVDPALLTGADPGDVFVVRNVANLVPPYKTGTSCASVPAAIEFAVESLLVEHVIVLGHSKCGGIHALMEGEGPGGEFIGGWVGIADRARARVLSELPGKPAELQQRACEQAAILISLENLMTYPWVLSRVKQGNLFLHGWYFDLHAGQLLHYDAARNLFEPV